MSRPRLLFVHNAPTRFVTIDRELLSERWEVIELFQNSRRLRPQLIWNSVRDVDLVFCWFASWHSFLPTLGARVVGKPSIVVVGGYDTANVPEAGYGHQRGGVKRRVARAVIQGASQIMVNSFSARDEAIKNAGAPPKSITVIHHGVPVVTACGPLHREPVVLTVGNVRHENLWRKGLLPFVRTAAHLPEAEFVVVGRWADDSVELLRAEAPPNVTFTGFVGDDELTRWYQRASVYVQASLHEGFGMSVAESMVAGCIPVVTRNGSLPEVVGGAGVFAASNDPVDLAEAVGKALCMDDAQRIIVRDRVCAEFSLERRRRALHDLIDKMLRDSRR